MNSFYDEIETGGLDNNFAMLVELMRQRQEDFERKVKWLNSPEGKKKIAAASLQIAVPKLMY